MNFFDGATTARPLTEYVVETDNMYMRNNGNYDIGPANVRHLFRTRKLGLILLSFLDNTSW